MDRIPLPLLPIALKRLTGTPGPSYRTCYAAAVDGRIPAARAENGRWTVAAEDLGEVAAALGRAPSSVPGAAA